MLWPCLPPKKGSCSIHLVETSRQVSCTYAFLLQEALAQISEYSEAGITVRGTYFTPGKPAPEGERKLYLAIESTNELAVSKAKIEITRLIKEELLKLQSSAHHIMNKARYKVI